MAFLLLSHRFSNICNQKWQVKLSLCTFEAIQRKQRYSVTDFRHVCISHVKCLRALFCLSVGMHVSTQLPTDDCLWNLILGTSMKICQGNPCMVKIGQKFLDFPCRPKCVSFLLAKLNKYKSTVFHWDGMWFLELVRRHCVPEKSGITHLTTHPHFQEDLNITLVVLCFVFVQSDLSSYFSFRYKSS